MQQKIKKERKVAESSIMAKEKKCMLYYGFDSKLKKVLYTPIIGFRS